MWRRLVPAGLALSCAQTSSAGAVILATNGQAKARIVLAADATRAEQTAAEELAAYLGKVTGARFQILGEGEAAVTGAMIHVGPTGLAKRAGLVTPGLGPEEWVTRTTDAGLHLVGGPPRGTLYAVYRFLEDIVGVHWWNPWEERVPAKPTLVVDKLDRRGTPVLRYRDIYMLYANDGGRFAARNRLNRQGDRPIAAEYGGALEYGPPYHVHTFYRYVPPERFFKKHPEWFSLVNGQRSGDQKQLCLTNQALRDFFVQKLKTYIRQSQEAAAKVGTSPPQVFSISQNDWGGACQCERCQAIGRAEQSEAAPLLHFVNYVADAVKRDFPGVYIDTLAYFYTDKPPTTVRPRDNVIVRLCDTNSNFIKPITDPRNAPFRERLRSWSRIAKSLRIWDYAVTYGPYSGFPMPTVHTYPVDYRFYAEHNVEGVFTEHEYPILADMRDFKIWMMMKLLEDPYRNYDELVRTFTDGFYGPAGRHIREYLGKLEAAARAKPSYLSMGGSPRVAHYLDLTFVRDAMAILDKAEEATAGDAVLLRRVRHARLSLDRAAVVLYRRLMQEWIKAGNPADAMPLDRDAIAKRYKRTWYEQIEFRLPERRRAAERKTADAELVVLTARPALLRLPEKFRGRPPGTVFDYPADTTRNYRDIVKVVPDPEAESGITNRLELRDNDADLNIAKYKLPMPWGLYDQINKKHPGKATIAPADVPGPGYHWYKMGTFAIGPSYYVYFFWSWIIQVDIDDVVDPRRPGRQFQVWARIKFEGPGFPHGRAEDGNAICVERLVLTRAEEE